MLTLMAALLVLLATLLSSAPVGTESGVAAVYGYPGDRLAGGPLACTGKLLRAEDRVCAHRTLPCGTPLLIQSMRSRRLATCQVLDRGPYGARLPGGRFVIKTRPSARGMWRGVVDLSPAVARMLGVRTSEPVRIIYLDPWKRATALNGGTPASQPACEKRPPGPRVEEHVKPHRPRRRARGMDEPLVSTRSPWDSGAARVPAQSAASANDDDALGHGAAGVVAALYPQPFLGQPGDGSWHHGDRCARVAGDLARGCG